MNEYRIWDSFANDFLAVNRRVGDDCNIAQPFTGLQDKIGKPLFLGDIVYCIDDAQYYEIVFHKGCFMLDTKDGLFSPLYEYVGDSLLVGNIFQNKNLIQKNENSKYI